MDAQGRRVGKKVNGTLVQGFLWESQLRVAAELDGGGKVVSRFVYGTKVNVPELIIKGSTTYRVITDHLGSPRLVVNTADGTVAQRVDYDEWGNVLADSSPGFQAFGFAGGLYERDLGLVRLGARDHEAGTGRWTRQEPAFRNPRAVKEYELRGIGLRSYSYAANDPLNNADVNGEAPSKWLRLGAVLMRLLGNAEKAAEHLPQYPSPGDPAKGIEKAKKIAEKAAKCGGAGGGSGPPPLDNVEAILKFLDSLSSTDILNLLNPVPWLEIPEPYDSHAPILDERRFDACVQAGLCT